jgi:hypothetical protein
MRERGRTRRNDSRPPPQRNKYFASASAVDRAAHDQPRQFGGAIFTRPITRKSRRRAWRFAILSAMIGAIVSIEWRCSDIAHGTNTCRFALCQRSLVDSVTE